MKQVRQYLKNGQLELGDVPMPAVGSGDVLVRSHFSFVSVGTEKMKVTQARMNLAEKVRERPDQVKQEILSAVSAKSAAEWKAIFEGEDACVDLIGPFDRD